MVKKSAGLLFILLANILLVVHTILPHQHYGGFARIKTDHKHQDHDHDQSCLLAQAYLVPVNPSRFACTLADHQHEKPDYQLIFADQNNSGYQPFFYKIPLPPLILPGRFPLAVTSCSGLRAPPAL